MNVTEFPSEILGGTIHLSSGRGKPLLDRPTNDIKLFG
jgi:hypothetical protein